MVTYAGLQGMIAAEGSVTLTMARPIADRDVDFATLSEEEQAARYRRAGVIKVSPCVTYALCPCQKGLLLTYAQYEGWRQKGLRVT
jgi:hypothetical protein